MPYVIIMAQGSQERLNGVIHYPKHFVPINGEPNILRTLAMLRACHRSEVEIIADPTRWSHWDDAHIPAKIVTLAETGNCINMGLQPILAVRRRNQRTAVLLGDVVWSQESLDLLFETSAPIVFLGTAVLTSSEGELFGFTFRSDMAEKVYVALRQLACNHEGEHLHQPGHLRNFFWHLQRHFPEEVVYISTTSETFDIDTPEAVQRLTEAQIP